MQKGGNKNRRWPALGLYQKFALLMIIVGLVPMLILTTFIANRMIDNYHNAMEQQYRQATGYLANSLENTLDSYNSILKLPYYYNMPAEDISASLSFDNFRQMLNAEGYSKEEQEAERAEDMSAFLQYVANVDPDIYAAHFIGTDSSGNELDYHYSSYSTWFRSEELFEREIGYDNWDKSSNRLIPVLTHSFSYFGDESQQVITIARNYFDLRGEIGSRTYVGTLFIDIPVQSIKNLVSSAKFGHGEEIYVCDQNNDCYFSSDESCIGQNVALLLEKAADTEERLTISTGNADQILGVTVVMDTNLAFADIRKNQQMMYAVIVAAIALIFFGSFYFSKRLVRPIHEMIGQMEEIEHGDFDIELPVRSEDEIGLLSRRFNRMSCELKNYINQSYLSKIKQSEAELTALKSQIYPHFLYNTLEVIRMTALEEGNANVPKMIEALSGQIHYLIGPVQDMVPLSKEIDIVQKYIYLLNCRINGKVQLLFQVPEGKEILVPRLILQPIVENAYVHGIKGKNGSGSIRIETMIEEDILQIIVMDNGIGMNKEELLRIRQLLEGNAPGIRSQDNWQSIGLKNVHDRLRFLYGEEYGVAITSTPGTGTMVYLVMPVRREEE